VAAAAAAGSLYRTAAAVPARPRATASATAAGSLYRPASGVADWAAGGEVLSLGVRLGERVGQGQQIVAQHGGGSQDRLYKYSKNGPLV
jgi:hypothetical protein